MGKFVTPQVYQIGQTALNWSELKRFCDDAKVTEFYKQAERCRNAGLSDMLVLSSFNAKLCYRAWQVGQNKNISKVREIEDNFKGIISSSHGSCLEHSQFNFVVRNCSRIFCYTEDTEVFTLSGWKRITDLTTQDSLLTMNPETRLAEWENPSSVKSFDFDGEVYGWSTSQMSSPMMTPDHLLWLAWHDRRRARQLTCEENVHQYGEKVPIAEAYGKSFVIEQSVKLAEVYDGEKTKIGDTLYDSADLFSFMGWMATDGHFDENQSSAMTISQSKTKNFAEIAGLMNRLFGTDWRRHGPLDGSNPVFFKVSNSVLAEFVKRNIGPKKTERVFGPLIMTASSRLLKCFIEAAIRGDGSICKKNERCVFYCPSRVAAGQYQVIFSMLGLSANLRMDDQIGASHLVNEQEVINKKVCYVVDVDRRSTASLIRKKHQYKFVHCGKVYCPVTKNGIIFVKGKGQPFWASNTHELVRHRVGIAFCLAGDTEIWSGSKVNGEWDGVRKKWTIGQLYAWSQDERRKGRLKLIKVRCLDTEGRFVPALLKSVFCSGEKDIFRIKLANGRSIRCSTDHRFLGENGWIRLGDLKIGNRLATNGIRTGLASTPEKEATRRERIRLSKLGNKNPNWKGHEVGDSGARRRARVIYLDKVCEICGSTKQVAVHHIDRDIRNNNAKNHRLLCNSCHGRLHCLEDGSPNELIPRWVPIIAIEPDGREMTYDLEVDHPSHNFVANGFVTHNSQTSGRYVRGDDCDLVWDIKLVADDDVMEFIGVIENFYVNLCKKYGLDDNQLPFDKKKELTSKMRRILPNGIANDIGVSLNMRTMRHIAALRTASPAEVEIRKVVADMYLLAKAQIPQLFFDAKEREVDGILEVYGMKQQPYEMTRDQWIGEFTTEELVKELERRKMVA